MKADYWILIGILVPAVVWTISSARLTVPGALAGALLGLLLYAGTGFTGLALMAVFFLLGTAATSWKRHFKETNGLAEKNKGRRTAGQVIANAGVAGLLAVLIWLPAFDAGLLRLMIAASFAAATADTLSSELGNVYGKRYYNILNLRQDARGQNGVVSIEGSLFGLAGSVVIAAVYVSGFGWNVNGPIIIVISGTLGNLADSVLGATLERRSLLNNDTVNFLNTLVAALAAMVLYVVF